MTHYQTRQANKDTPIGEVDEKNQLNSDALDIIERAVNNFIASSIIDNGTYNAKQAAMYALNNIYVRISHEQEKDRNRNASSG